MNAVVTGGCKGLGAEIVRELLEYGAHVTVLDKATPIQHDLLDPHNGTLSVLWCDVSDRRSVNRAVAGIPEQVDVLVNNAGVNEISFFEDLPEAMWDRVLGVNAKGIFNVTQALFSRLLHSEGTVCNVTSNAAWVPMTSSLAYNTSKAAAHMMTVQMAHEFHRRHIPITVFGVAPGKLSGTPMSEYIEQRVVETRGWTPEYARSYQLGSLKAGQETDPAQLAEFIGMLLSKKERHRQLAGCILPYGA